MALKVTTAKSGKVSIGKNTGMQGSNYNPQKTAPAKTIQSAAPVRVVQPAAGIRSVQPTAPARAVQPAATAAQVNAAIAVARAQAAAAAAVAAAQAKAVLRQKVQGQVDTKVAANKDAFKLSVSTAQFKGKVSVSKANPRYKIVQPEPTDYDKAYQKAYQDAVADYEKQRKPGKQNLLDKVVDTVTFGQDRRDVAARQYAESRAKKIMDTDFKKYEGKINSYNSKLASVQAAVNRAATTMTQSQFDAYVKQQQDRIDREYKSLVAEGAVYDGRTAAYGKKSSAPSTTITGKTLAGTMGFFDKAINQNPVGRFLLGQGWENIPSVFTALSRGVNTVGNILDKNRTIYQYGNTTTSQKKTGQNAWQASFNQRNLNLAPAKPKPFDKNAAYKELSSVRFADSPAQRKILAGFKNAKTEADREKFARQYWNDKNRTASVQKDVQEFAADPLFFTNAAAKGVKYVAGSTKIGGTLKNTKAGSLFSAAADKLKTTSSAFKSKIAENKTVKWLGAEHQAPADKFFETTRAAKDLSRAQQEVFLEKIKKVSEKLAVNPKYDLSIFDDLKALTPKEREVLQRMSGDGKLAFRDFASHYGRGMKPWRERMQQVAQRYIAFTEEMKLADNVSDTATAYGRGKKMYSPRTVWAENLDDYDFRLKRGKGIQSGDDFLHGVTDRFFKSNLDEVMARRGTKYVKYTKQLKEISSDYERSFHNARATVQAAEKRYKRDATGVTGWIRNKKNIRSEVSLGRSVFNTAKNIQATPTRVWKKSVLKYRPAWTVNNVLYNTQAGVLAGGSGALIEQAKMLNPRYYRRAMDESRQHFGGNLGKEIGGRYRGRNVAKRFDQKLTKFYTGVEDWSRVAAGRAAMKKGMTEEQAKKRVNKYLFDYKTANWERPIKAVVPFWSFQKNLAKASAAMPFDRPLAAAGYNRLDRYQQQQFNEEFKTVEPKLKELGYTDAEILAMREENAKYYRGRLKVGDRWMTTPFNAFSEKGLSQMGLNPYLSAAKEIATSTDQYGRTISGKESGFMRRLMSKFPQAELGYNFHQSYEINAGRLKPSIKYIGKAGHDGFGLGKEKQGYDPTKKNYMKSMDPRTKLGANALAFLGVPKSMTFDKPQFIKTKTLQKLTADYFKLDTTGLEFADAEAKRTALFKKYGVTADEFYKGVLSKYDTDNTTKIKGLKEEAAAANKALFEEYGRQPQGTRNVWVTKKLRELNAAGYFDKNPYLKSFKYVSPTSVAKADKQLIVQEAIRTGNWSKYRSIYGLTQKQKDYEYATKTGNWSNWQKKYGKTAKATARDHAVATGDWSEYAEKYGTTRKVTPHQYSGKYFKTPESMQKYKDGEFWQKYTAADKEGRRKLLADNPQYNKRGNWTVADWLADKKVRKAELKKNAMGFGNISTLAAQNRGEIQVKALRFKSSLGRRQKKVVFKSA